MGAGCGYVIDGRDGERRPETALAASTQTGARRRGRHEPPGCAPPSPREDSNRANGPHTTRVERFYRKVSSQTCRSEPGVYGLQFRPHS